MIGLALAGCVGPGTWPAPAPPEVGCVVDEANGLRGVCEVTLAAPGRARLVLEAEGEAPRLYRSQDAGRVHRIPVWGLPEETTFAWTAVDEATGAAAEGALTTGRLPRSMREVSVEVTVADDERQVEAVLLSPSCMAGVLWMVDRDGRIVWWQQVDDAGLGAVTGLTWTEDGTALALAARQHVVEVDVLGEVLLDLNRGEDFEDFVHHDLTRAGGDTYVLHSHVVEDEDRRWMADGVYVFGPDGDLVDDLELDGLFPRVVRPWMQSGYWIRDYPDAVDTTHANAVHVDAGGDVWVSLRHLSSVGRFAGGPGTDGFGALELLIAGEEDSPVWEDADLVPAGGPKEHFSGQHDPHLGDEGDLWMFDNRMLLPGTARAVHYGLDEDSGRLEQREAWDTGLTCPVQGTVRRLPGGNVVVTCASEGEVFEFAPGRPDPVWRVAPRCGPGTAGGFPRALPVDLP